MSQARNPRNTPAPEAQPEPTESGALLLTRVCLALSSVAAVAAVTRGLLGVGTIAHGWTRIESGVRWAALSELLAALVLLAGALAGTVGRHARGGLLQLGLGVTVLGGTAVYVVRVYNLFVRMHLGLPETIDQWDFMAFTLSQSLDSLLCAGLAGFTWWRRHRQ